MLELRTITASRTRMTPTGPVSDVASFLVSVQFRPAADPTRCVAAVTMQAGSRPGSA